MIEPVMALVEDATSYVETEVDSIINNRITDTKRIDKALDMLLNCAGMSMKADHLFRRLCNYYFYLGPVMTSEWIGIYRGMYCTDSYDGDETGKDDDIDVLVETKRKMGSMAMTIITGDTHGDFQRIEAMCVLVGTTADDLLIILGDVGINYYGGKKDAMLKASLASLPITMFCLHGNHERRPESTGLYKEVEWRGGAAYMEPAYPNLLFAKDGEVYIIDGKSHLAIGGAYSVDKEYRLERGWGWWADEQPSEDIKRRVERRLDIENWRVDVVLSHTAPLKYEPREVFLDFIDDSRVDKGTEKWLDTIEDRLDYDEWYCGHYHTDKTIDKIRFMYRGAIST